MCSAWAMRALCYEAMIDFFICKFLYSLLLFAPLLDILLLETEFDWELRNGNWSLLTYNQSLTLFLFLFNMCLMIKQTKDWSKTNPLFRRVIYSKLFQFTQIHFIYHLTSVLLVDVAHGKSYKSERDCPAMSKSKKSQNLFETPELQLPDNLNSLDSDTIIHKFRENESTFEKKSGKIQHSLKRVSSFKEKLIFSFVSTSEELPLLSCTSWPFSSILLPSILLPGLHLPVLISW